MNTDKIAEKALPIAFVALLAGAAIHVRNMIKGKWVKKSKSQPSTSGDDDTDLDSYDLEDEEEANAAIEPVTYDTPQAPQAAPAADEYDPAELPTEAPPLAPAATARPTISFAPRPTTTVPPGFTIKKRKKRADPAKK